jgi:hypothetical protein
LHSSSVQIFTFGADEDCNAGMKSSKNYFKIYVNHTAFWISFASVGSGLDDYELWCSVVRRDDAATSPTLLSR